MTEGDGGDRGRQWTEGGDGERRWREEMDIGKMMITGHGSRFLSDLGSRGWV